MRLVLRGDKLLEMGEGARNPHQLSLQAGVSYTTVARYVERSESVQSLDLKVLPTLVIRGLKVSPQQLLEMKIGDLFSFEDGE